MSIARVDSIFLFLIVILAWVIGQILNRSFNVPDLIVLLLMLGLAYIGLALFGKAKPKDGPESLFQYPPDVTKGVS